MLLQLQGVAGYLLPSGSGGQIWFCNDYVVTFWGKIGKCHLLVY